jgi:hypothetical protein
MKKVSFIAIVAVFLLGSVISVQAADAQGIDIGRYGIYKADIVKKEDSEKAAAGYKTISENAVFLKQTDTIEAVVGTKFGFEYVINGSPEDAVLDITVRYVHPPITNPATGKTVTSQEIITPGRSIGKPELIGYSFDEAWEIADGQWTIQLFYGDRKLAEKTFTIVKQK